MRSLLLVLSLTPLLAVADEAADCRALGGVIKKEAEASGCLVKKKREGVWRTLGPGGQLMEETTWKAGKKNGPSVGYFVTCQVRWRGGFLDGQRHGEWKDWAFDGKPLSAGTYDRGVRVGQWTTFHPESGEKHLEGPYVSGLQHGLFKEHLVTGELWREVEFVQGERGGKDAEACRKKGGEWLVELGPEPSEGCKQEGERTGQWRTFDGHGKLRSISTWVKGVQTGRFEEFHPTGELLRLAMYKDGLPEGVHEFTAPDGGVYGRSVIQNATGEWRAWHPTGKMAVQGRYRAGCPEGEWRVWDAEGQLVVIDHYAECRRNGLYTDFHEGGAPRRSGVFVDGVEDGVWEQRWQNGKLEWQGQYAKGERTGTFKLYRWDGSPYRQGAFVNDLQEGPWEFYFPNGKREAAGEYESGKLSGEWRYQWPTGGRWREAPYVNGREATPEADQCRRWAGNWVANVEKGALGCQVCRVKPDDSVEWIGVGVWTFWHPDGTIEKRGALVDGRPTGHWEYFHDTGEVMLEGDYDGGVEQGGWRGFYRTGAARFVGGYVDGKPEGEWTSYHPDGGLLSVGRYVKGQKAGRWTFVTRGTPEEVIFTPDGGR